MKLNNLHDLFILEIQDLYDGELQITQAIPQVMSVLQSEELKKSFQEHLEETKQQITRLEQICKEFNVDPRGKSCVGMEGIIEEAVELMQENAPSPVLDAGIIACAQKVEHYEIAGYGTAATFAKEMGHEHALKLLLETLAEEKACDHKLTELAKTQENIEALPKEGMQAM